jgi:hypothetical protein
MCPAFNEFTQTRKGTFGEEIVDPYLRKLGFIPYRPIIDHAHPFDRLCASLDKRTLFVSDAKAKARRNKYPDTGIDMSSYLTYKYAFLYHRLDTFLAFVDEIEGSIYGGFLNELDQWQQIKTKHGLLWYPKTENNGESEIRYFPVARMQTIGRLSDNEAKILKQLSTRNPEYDREPKFLFS